MPTRRNLIKTVALAGSGMLAFRNATSAWAAPVSPERMPLGPLGRTGIQVSKIGLGAASLGRDEVSDKEAANIIAMALDEGINYVDTAPNYNKGQSERRCGSALKGKRDKVFLVTKTEEESYEGTMRLLEESLKHLQTDHVDLVHLHNFGLEKRWKDHDFAFSDKGAMGALREAKKKGMVRFVGVSGHLHPSRFQYAIDSDEIDVMMMAVNFVNQHTYDFEHKIWTQAAEKNMGLASMKVFGGRDQKSGGHRLPAEDYENALRYTLTLKGLSTAVIGIGSTAHLTRLLKTFHGAEPLSKEEFEALAQRGLDLMETDTSLQAMHGKPIT